MTEHDPLCPKPTGLEELDWCCPSCSPGEVPPWERNCECETIAKVRAACIAAVESVYLRTDDGEILRQGGSWENALDRAIAAIKSAGEL